jgi:AcrR family transcriptional regulator
VTVQRSDRRQADRAEFGPLPGGHHGLSREQVRESQRERLLAGIAQAVAANGYRATGITQIVKAASVSSRAFYELFESKEECFLEAFDAVVEHLEGLVTQAAQGEPDWPHQVIAGLRAALRFFAEEPDLARLCLVEPVTATPVIATRFRDVVIDESRALKPGRLERGEAGELPDSTEDSLLGGLIALVSRSILAGDGDSLEGLLPDLLDFVLSPYLGPDGARRLVAELAEDRS